MDRLVRAGAPPALPLAAGTLAVALLLGAWLGRAEPVDAGVRAVRQQRALVLASFVLATFAVPWAFALLVPGRHTGSAYAGYAAALPAPLVLVVLAAWLVPRGDTAAVDVTHAGVLLLGYGALLCAATDAGRLAAPVLGLFVPMVAGSLACLSPFAAGPWVEHAADQPEREIRIAWVVAVNPLLAATATLPGYDPLRAEHVYERTPIGAYFVYRLPDAWHLVSIYLALAAALGGGAGIARRWLHGPSHGRVPPLPSDA